MTDEEARELAEAHWKWLEVLLHQIYVDAMVHGCGHGFEDCERKYKVGKYDVR